MQGPLLLQGYQGGKPCPTAAPGMQAEALTDGLALLKFAASFEKLRKP